MMAISFYSIARIRICEVRNHAPMSTEKSFAMYLPKSEQDSYEFPLQQTRPAQTKPSYFLPQTEKHRVSECRRQMLFIRMHPLFMALKRTTTQNLSLGFPMAKLLRSMLPSSHNGAVVYAVYYIWQELPKRWEWNFFPLLWTMKSHRLTKIPLVYPPTAGVILLKQWSAAVLPAHRTSTGCAT